MHRTLVAFMLLVGVSSAAADTIPALSARAPRKQAPAASPVPRPAGVVRQGGDTVADAVVIPALPHQTAGTTAGYADDYDETCPYSGSTSPDVVYSYRPDEHILVDIDLAGSAYDTKLYVYDEHLALVACNDDFYPDYVSKIENLALQGGVRYFIVIDGWGGDFGDYLLNIVEYDPCVLEPFPRRENEPPLVDGYVDSFNSGCNGAAFGSPMFELHALDFNGFQFSGQSGWYVTGGETYRDLDWYVTHLDETGRVEISIIAEIPLYLFQLAPLDCDSVEIVQYVECGECDEQTLMIEGSLFEEIWLAVIPQSLSGPTGEHDYSLSFDVASGYWPDLDERHDQPLTARELFGSVYGLDVDVTSAADDLSQASLCGGEATPGADVFARVYLEAGQTLGGQIFPFYYSPARGGLRLNRTCVSLTTDPRPGADACVGVHCAEDYNTYYGFTAEQTGWHYLMVDFVSPEATGAWLTALFDVVPRPEPPPHDMCAGARPLPTGLVDLADDLTAATDRFDPGRDGCEGQENLRFTGRDVFYQVDLESGWTLDLTMQGDGDWDEALYLVRDCELPLAGCVAAGVPDGDGVRLVYTSAEPETLWLVCDSWGAGPRPFTLVGSLGTATAVPGAAAGAPRLLAAPNPFNPRVVISYDLPRPGAARLRIHAMDGRVVATLVDRGLAAGGHEAIWSGRDAAGRPVPSGVYIARLETAAGELATRLTLLK